MISYSIIDVRKFFQKLLKEEMFDNFYCNSFDMTLLYKVSVDGQNYDFEEDKNKEEIEPYIRWKQFKEIAFNMIKGNKTPSSMKIVFSLGTDAKKALLSKCKTEEINAINGFSLSIIYNNKELKFITGTNYSNFTLSKDAENYFDETMKRFFKKNDLLIQ